MIFPGLVSVTFRALKPEEIISLAASAGLKGIEWGGDIHVPPGKPEIARQVRELTRASGLQISSYGSYYNVGTEHPAEEFAPVLDTALELGVGIIRVWAGNQGSAQASPEYRQRLAANTRKAAEASARHRIDLAFEFHGGTLTDTADSTLALLAEINHPNVKTYWQAPGGMSPEECALSLRQVLPHLANIHVTSWNKDLKERQGLAENEIDWQRYLRIAATTGGDHFALLEFVRNDDPAALKQDAAVLIQLLTSNV